MVFQINSFKLFRKTITIFLGFLVSGAKVMSQCHLPVGHLNGSWVLSSYDQSVIGQQLCMLFDVGTD